MDNRIEIDNIEDRIRSKLGVSEPYLSNKDINQPDIITVAEANIISMFPNYSTLDGDAKIYLETAVVLECCILLSPSMAARLPKKETGPHAGHELWVNWDNKKSEFITERDSLLGKINELLSPTTVDTFKSFTVTYPKRGW